MSVITNKWNDGSGDSINIESPSFQGNQTVKISSPVQKGTSKRSMKFIGKCKKDSSKQVILIVEQEASTYTYDLTLNGNNTEIAAKGGTANITAVLKTYRNGNLVSTDNVTPVLSGSATGFSISGTKVTASNRTTTVGSRRSIVVTGKYSNTFDGQTVSSTITIYQEANEASYGVLTGGSISASDIPASGGTSSTSISNMLQTISYTSGSTRAGTVTYSKTSEITVSSLGTTVKARTKVGQVTVTYTGEGGATANKTVDIYQAENKVTNSNYNPRITAYGTPTISIGSGLTAAGGSATVSASVTNTETYNALYSSGATGPNQTRSVDGSLSISMTVNGNSRFSLSGNTITHSSMGTNETTDTVTIKAVNNGDNSKSATASKSITNSKTVKSTSGGVYTYGNITAGTITNATIPASGGSATAKAGNGTQNWSKSATITTYQYDSGSTKDVTTEAASSGTANVVPNVASITATASSKGTTVSAQTTVKSQAVTWSANGKSASETMYIYQEANKIESYNYGSWNIGITANPTTIAASGGTSAITASCTRTKTPVYTSGSTGTATTESATPTLAISGTGFTLSGTTVTASKNNVAARTATITASYSGATSKSVTITQSAGPDGIGYMQIEGNGVDHYIFQVGRTPNTRSNDVQTLSEEPAEVATETKSESLFAKIKRIVTNLN
jgi:ribosome-associated translation inhibitor RaiA